MTLKYLFPLTAHKTKLDFIISFSSKHQQQFFLAVPRTLFQYNITVVIKYGIYKIFTNYFTPLCLGEKWLHGGNLSGCKFWRWVQDNKWKNGNELQENMRNIKETTCGTIIPSLLPPLTKEGKYFKTQQPYQLSTMFTYSFQHNLS